MLYLKVLTSYLFSSSVSAGAPNQDCKCSPHDSCWPSKLEWLLLNHTLNGALIHSTPPASVCYPSQPNYNDEACAVIRSRWFDSTFHAQDPISIDYPIWANNSCNPIYPNGTSVTGELDAGEKGCSIGNYPVYVVNATTSQQISTALKWAGKKNIRVVVKGTGHSYGGRSTGYAALSIWTHNLRSVSYHPVFSPTSCTSTYAGPAVRIAAGHTGLEVQSYLSNYSSIIVTGANPSVGLIGWLTGGGHGTLSSSYGTGADNLLEASIVLPSGQILLTNPCVNPDLFFAIRGGGGGTFGVVTEIVVKAFPSPKTTLHMFKLAALSPNTSAQFWMLMGFIHGQMADLKAGGMQGYYFILGPPVYPTLAFVWVFYLYDKPVGTAERLIAPIVKNLEGKKELFVYESEVKHTDTYWESWGEDFSNELVANGGSAYGSRLMSPESLSNPNETAKVFEDIGPRVGKPNAPYTNPALLGHMIAPFPNATLYSPSTISLNPAWRNTLVHLIVVAGWPPNTLRTGIDAVYAEITAKTQKLRNLSPDTGAYFNEADANEPDWQKSFWGKNYKKLAEIKRRLDPGNVLWCQRCVGSDKLEESGDGTLCRVKEHEDRTEDGRGGMILEGKTEERWEAGNVDVQTKEIVEEAREIQRAY